MPNSTQKALAVMLASTFVVGVQPKSAQSNPAAALAPALCSTGVGCLLVGTVVIGGGLYYVWEYGGGKKVAADAAGNIMRMLDDPDNPDGEWEDPLDTRNEEVARKVCKRTAQNTGAKLIRIDRHPVTRRLICVFQGGNS